MNDKDIELLEESFKKFYFDHFNLIHVPQNPNQREFGFQKFNSGMNRHISLKTDKELHLLLMQKIPSDVYCSNACYSFPNLPMNEKDWKNAELIFDIDAKDLDVIIETNILALNVQNVMKLHHFSSHAQSAIQTKFQKLLLHARIVSQPQKNK